MQRARINYIYVIALILVSLLLYGIQTVFWYQVVGNYRAPSLWLNLLLYLALYRSRTEAYITSYLLGPLFCAFTVTSLGYYWLTCFVLVTFALFIKSRVFWPGPRYFLFASLGIGLSNQLFNVIAIQYIERRDYQFHFFDSFFDIVLTGLSSFLVFYLMSAIDRWTNKHNLPESGGLEI